MDTFSAFARGEATRNQELKVFDWDHAAKLIRERKSKVARAGLGMDWEWTGGTIYENGQPVKDSYTYLASTWATPELELDGEVFDCYKMQSETPNWDAGTTWPESALEILGATNDI